MPSGLHPKGDSLGILNSIIGEDAKLSRALKFVIPKEER